VAKAGLIMQWVQAIIESPSDALQVMGVSNDE